MFNDKTFAYRLASILIKIVFFKLCLSHFLDIFRIQAMQLVPIFFQKKHAEMKCFSGIRFIRGVQIIRDQLGTITTKLSGQPIKKHKLNESKEGYAMIYSKDMWVQIRVAR